MTVTTLSTELGGRTLTIETGKLARLAGGAVTVRYGDTLLLGTANRAEPRPGLDFFPLTIDFEERMYAAGKIPGGFIKREARELAGLDGQGPTTKLGRKGGYRHVSSDGTGDGPGRVGCLSRGPHPGVLGACDGQVASAGRARRGDCA